MVSFSDTKSIIIQYFFYIFEEILEEMKAIYLFTPYVYHFLWIV